MHYIMCLVRVSTAINNGLVTAAPCRCHLVANSDKLAVEDSISFDSWGSMSWCSNSYFWNWLYSKSSQRHNNTPQDNHSIFCLIFLFCMDVKTFERERELLIKASWVSFFSKPMTFWNFLWPSNLAHKNYILQL